MSLLQRFFGRSGAAGITRSDSPDPQREVWLKAAVHQAADRATRELVSGMRGARRGFESAETPAWTSSWSTSASDINDTLARQLSTMANRATGLARNDEWAVRYLKQLEDNVLGEDGIALQMRVKTAAGDLDTVANAELEAHYADWCRRGACEVSGRLSWRECENLLLGSIERTGEILYRLRPGAGPYGFQIQILRPELLDVNLRRDWGGNRVRMGVEINNDGAPVAYWLRAAKVGDGSGNSDITTVGKHVRIPADQIRHRFFADEIDQLRGVPGLSAGARRLWLLHDFEESAAVASSNAAKRQGFFVSPDGKAPPGMADTIVSAVLDSARAEGKQLSPEEIATITAAAEKYTTTMPGQFDTIPLGYDFRPFESKWPEVSADGYIKGQLRGFSAARGVSYHTLGNDLESVNYSSAQVGIGDERKRYRTWQKRLIDWVHTDVGAEVIKRAPLYRPALKASRVPDYLAAMTWLPPTWQPIDPLKAAESDDIALRNRSTTRRRIWLSKGLDPDEMEAEVLAEEVTFGRLDTPATAGTTARSDRHDKPASAG